MSRVDNHKLLHYLGNMNISTTLRDHRKAIGLTQQQLAEAASLHRNTYLNYELGKRLPPLDASRRLAEILHTTVDELFPNETTAA